MYNIHKRKNLYCFFNKIKNLYYSNCYFLKTNFKIILILVDLILCDCNLCTWYNIDLLYVNV